MDARKLLFAQFYLIALVGVLDIVGYALYLYWVFWWYDILVHFIGGMWVAVAAYWIFALYAKVPQWAHVLLIVLSIGTMWEVFEYVIGLSFKPDFILDTSIDYLMDILGGCVGVIVARKVGKTAAG